MNPDNHTLTYLLSKLSSAQWREALNRQSNDVEVIRQLTEVQEQNGNYIKADIPTNKKETEALYGY